LRINGTRLRELEIDKVTRLQIYMYYRDPWNVLKVYTKDIKVVRRPSEGILVAEFV
jgi:hypothetical protein